MAPGGTSLQSWNGTRQVEEPPAMATGGSAWVNGILSGIRIGLLQGGMAMVDGCDDDSLAAIAV